MVIETMTKVKLESLFHVGRRLHEWVPWKLLGSNLALEQRDRVVYDDWVGTVEEVSQPLALPHKITPGVRSR